MSADDPDRHTAKLLEDEEMRRRVSKNMEDPGIPDSGRFRRSITLRSFDADASFPRPAN